MKKLFVTSVLLLGLSFTTLDAQQRPPRPAEKELVSAKRQELDKKYAIEKKLIMNHPIASKKMKSDQMRVLNRRYKAEIKLLNQAK